MFSIRELYAGAFEITQSRPNKELFEKWVGALLNLENYQSSPYLKQWGEVNAFGCLCDVVSTSGFEWDKSDNAGIQSFAGCWTLPPASILNSLNVPNFELSRLIASIEQAGSIEEITKIIKAVSTVGQTPFHEEIDVYAIAFAVTPEAATCNL